MAGANPTANHDHSRSFAFAQTASLPRANILEALPEVATCGNYRTEGPLTVST